MLAGMAYASKIIDRFGGTRAMATALGLPPSTVQSWKEVGLIPAKHQQAILDEARARGIDLEPADFFDAPNPPPPSQAEAAA